MVIAIPLLWIATSLDKIATELADLRFAADLIERRLADPPPPAKGVGT
jgi:hypothetical protein